MEKSTSCSKNHVVIIYMLVLPHYLWANGWIFINPQQKDTNSGWVGTCHLAIYLKRITTMFKLLCYRIAHVKTAKHWHRRNDIILMRIVLNVWITIYPAARKKNTTLHIAINCERTTNNILRSTSNISATAQRLTITTTFYKTVKIWGTELDIGAQLLVTCVTHLMHWPDSIWFGFLRTRGACTYVV